MTTIIGIKANSGIEGIVLCADQQLTTFDGEKPTLKEQIGKITYGENWIMGYAGGISNPLAVFLQYKNSTIIITAEFKKCPYLVNFVIKA